MIRSVCDFETASAANLKKVGAWAYAEHPTTEVLCLSFEDSGSVWTWTPATDHPVRVIRRMAADPAVIFVSHGDFERAIWRCIMVPVYGFPDIPNERWEDTMAVAAMKQLPLKLEHCLAVTGAPLSKDTEGSRLTISLSKPNRKSGMLDRSPATMARVYSYCESDVKAERWLANRLGKLQPGEEKVWQLDQLINQRGVRVDLDYVAACQKVVSGVKVPLEKEFSVLTGGLRPTQRERLMEWLVARGTDLPNLRKETLEELLGGEDDEDDGGLGDSPVHLLDELGGDGLPTEVRRALTIRQLVGSAAIKKLGTVSQCTSSDGRARGLLQYHRAGTGRWAGRILQPQNFPRPSLKDEDDNLFDRDLLVAALMTGDWEYVEMMCGPAVQSVVSGLRHMLVPARGHQFVSGDYAQIEARVVLALAGQYDKCALFEKSGSAVYIDMASSIYDRPIDKKNDIAEYTIGKNTVLGCGFQMGGKTFFDRYCPKQSLDFAQRVVNTYRRDFAPMVPDVWEAIGGAAIDAVWSGKTRSAYGVEYKLNDGWLTARLPSGRLLYYWNPRPERLAMPWSTPERPDIRPAFTYNAIKMGRWCTIKAFGGLLTENVVQALARDILVDAMFKIEAEGYPIVLTVHDEILSEVEDRRVDEKVFAEVMKDRPAWAVSMKVPIGTETWTGDRYRK